MRQIESKDLYTQELYDRYQADYDYNGELPEDHDPADVYKPLHIKAVRVA